MGSKGLVTQPASIWVLSHLLCKVWQLCICLFSCYPCVRPKIMVCLSSPEWDCLCRVVSPNTDRGACLNCNFIVAAPFHSVVSETFFFFFFSVCDAGLEAIFAILTKITPTKQIFQAFSFKCLSSSYVSEITNSLISLGHENPTSLISAHLLNASALSAGMRN